MQETPMQNLNSSQDEIDFRELYNVLLTEKKIIFSITFLASIIGVIYSLLLPNIYESKALLVSSNTSSSISGALRGISGLAGLAGVSIPGDANQGNASRALKKIQSLSFFEKNLLTNIYLPDLMAVSHWDPQTNILIYDKNIFDINKNSWVGLENSKKKTPSTQRSFNKFISDHLTIVENKTTGFIHLSIKHQSPHIAKKWTKLVVDEVNNFYRQKDKFESEKAASYLKQQISMTNLSEIKQVLAELLQEETKKLTLVEANEYYVFEYVDPPEAMEKESGPDRFLIQIVFLLLGAFLSILFVLTRHYLLIKK